MLGYKNHVTNTHVVLPMIMSVKLSSKFEFLIFLRENVHSSSIEVQLKCLDFNYTSHINAHFFLFS